MSNGNPAKGWPAAGGSRAAKWTASAYRSGRLLADFLRLRRFAAGRRALASLNMAGQFLASRFLFRSRLAAEVDGHRIQLAGSHGPSPALAGAMIAGNYEPATRLLVERLLPEGGAFIDVGAHVGLYTLLAAGRVGPRGRVFAFEPEADNYRLLRKNIELNGYANVMAVPLALRECSGKASLFVSRQGNDRHSLFRNPRSPLREHGEVVETATLDDFLAAVGWPEIDLIKMDIEGAEPFALAGMRLLLERSRRLNLIVEFSPEMLEAGRTPPCEFLASLAAQNLEVFIIEDDAPLARLYPSQFAAATVRIRARGAANLLCRKGQSTAPEEIFAYEGETGARG